MGVGLAQMWLQVQSTMVTSIELCLPAGFSDPYDAPKDWRLRTGDKMKQEQEMLKRLRPLLELESANNRQQLTEHEYRTGTCPGNAYTPKPCTPYIPRFWPGRGHNLHL